LIIQKIKGYLSIANKAGYLIIGSENLKGYNKKLYLVLADIDGGKSLIKIANNLKEKTQNEVYFLENIENLVSIPNCKIVGIKNLGLSNQIINLLRSDNFGKEQ
jgi:hypothetical protein